MQGNIDNQHAFQKPEPSQLPENTHRNGENLQFVEEDFNNINRVRKTLLADQERNRIDTLQYIIPTGRVQAEICQGTELRA